MDALFHDSANMALYTILSRPDPVDMEEIKELVEVRRADLRAKDNCKGETILSCACSSGQVVALQYLLLTLDGTDVDMRNVDGKTPLHSASLHGHLDCVKLLCGEPHRANVEARDGAQQTALMLAAGSDQADVVRFLAEEMNADIACIDVQGRNALLIAADDGHMGILKYLLEERNADVNTTQYNGWTLLMNAASGGHLHMVVYLVESRGVNVNASDRDGKNATMVAASMGRLEVLQYFVEKCAVDIQACDNGGRTVFMETFQEEYGEETVDAGRRKVANYLAEKGSDLNAKDHEGRSALFWAVLQNDIKGVSFLLDRNADLSVVNAEGVTVFDLEMSEDLRGVLIEERDRRRDPGLKRAVAEPVVGEAGAVEDEEEAAGGEEEEED